MWWRRVVGLIVFFIGCLLTTFSVLITIEAWNEEGSDLATVFEQGTLLVVLSLFLPLLGLRLVLESLPSSEPELGPGARGLGPFSEVRRGYDPEQVDRYLTTVMRWVSDLRNGRVRQATEAGLTPQAIREHEFSTVPRGYDPDEVRARLIALADEGGTLETELLI